MLVFDQLIQRVVQCLVRHITSGPVHVISGITFAVVHMTLAFEKLSSQRNKTGEDSFKYLLATFNLKELHQLMLLKFNNIVKSLNLLNC